MPSPLPGAKNRSIFVSRNQTLSFPDVKEMTESKRIEKISSGFQTSKELQDWIFKNTRPFL